MKASFTPLWALTAVMAATPLLAFDVPKSAHSADEIGKAVTEATKSKRGVVFVASDSSLNPT